jgi:hypothetical protein
MEAEEVATETADWPQCCRIRPPLPTMPRGAAKTLRADGVDTCESCLQYSSSCLDHLASCKEKSVSFETDETISLHQRNPCRKGIESTLTRNPRNPCREGIDSIHCFESLIPTRTEPLPRRHRFHSLFAWNPCHEGIGSINCLDPKTMEPLPQRHRFNAVSKEPLPRRHRFQYSMKRIV